MREVLDELMAIWRSGATAGLGTVVQTFNSAPRPAGASMVVGPDGRASGSVSGGCVEGDVYAVAEDVLASGTPVLMRYGVSDDDAYAVGLTCGGVLDVFVQPISQSLFPDLEKIAEDVEKHRPVAIATVIEHPNQEWIGRRIMVGESSASGSLGSQRADDAVTDDVRGLLASGLSEVLTYGPDGQRRGQGMRVFCASFAPRPRMLVFGAIDFAAAVAEQGALLGYRVTVCDAREVFATSERFPRADDVVVDWPHRYLTAQVADGLLDARSVICVLTHDPKFDIPLLEVALTMPRIAFVGAMGSRRTHLDRIQKLREAGLTDVELAGLSSPIGLDLGARTPQETAVSIAAEIIARRWGGTGEPLATLHGRIHRDR